MDAFLQLSSSGFEENEQPPQSYHQVLVIHIVFNFKQKEIHNHISIRIIWSLPSKDNSVEISPS